jgi:hypothetical protein
MNICTKMIKNVNTFIPNGLTIPWPLSEVVILIFFIRSPRSLCINILVLIFPVLCLRYANITFEYNVHMER